MNGNHQENNNPSDRSGKLNPIHLTARREGFSSLVLDKCVNHAIIMGRGTGRMNSALVDRISSYCKVPKSVSRCATLELCTPSKLSRFQQNHPELRPARAIRNLLVKFNTICSSFGELITTCSDILKISNIDFGKSNATYLNNSKGCGSD